MNNNKMKSFVFYADWYNAIKILDDNVRLEIYDAIMDNVFGSGNLNLSEQANIAMLFIKPQLDRDTSKWLEIKKKREESGRKGGISKSKQNIAIAKFAKQNKQNLANEADNNNINVNVDNNVVKEENIDTNVSNKKSSKSFVPPTLEEVESYIREKGYYFDAETFVSFYESKGWMVGKNKMKDWKAACRTWENSRREKAEDSTSRRIDKSVPEFRRFAEWVDEYYPLIRDMEMPDEQKYNEMKKMVNGDFMWACDNLQDDYHTGSLYDLFKERFGSN